MDNFEILTLQLQTLEKYTDLALAHHLPSMVVIHGVGSGKLRDEIHEALRLKKGVKIFFCQSLRSALWLWGHGGFFLNMENEGLPRIEYEVNDKITG